MLIITLILSPRNRQVKGIKLKLYNKSSLAKYFYPALLKAIKFSAARITRAAHSSILQIVIGLLRFKLSRVNV